jgi:hypothetical protein
VILGVRREGDENCALRVFTQRVVVIYYRRFGTTYFFTLEVGTYMFSRNTYNKLPSLSRNNPEQRSFQNVGNFFIYLAVEEHIVRTTH